MRNTGRTRGSDIPQVYLGPAPGLSSSIQQAVSKLVGFEQVNLNPGESQQVTLHVTGQQLSSWSSVAGSWQLGTGTRALWIGSSSRDPLLQGTVAVK